MSKDWKKHQGVTSVQLAGLVCGVYSGYSQLALQILVSGLGFWPFCFGHTT